MKTKSLLSLFAVAAFAAISVQNLGAHCQVPCGIFADQIEFEKILEDSGLPIVSADNLADAAEKVVKVTQEAA
ncbi:MAG: hypothetical protein EBU57_01100 [Alphaproteobacteria bacterium]|nr:hypothetical protein [Alphaproteobacteria bacterium]